jgi:hypothetical protein
MNEPLMGNAIATQVFHRCQEALAEGLEKGSLMALAYSEKKREGWFVFETYWRVLRDWDRITSCQCSDWDWHLELGFPSACDQASPVSPKKRFDMGLGPTITSPSGAKFARNDTPVFQAKMLRTWKTKEDLAQLAEDANTARKEGMLNAFLIVLGLVHPPRRKVVWKDQSSEVGRYLAQIKQTPALEAIPGCSLWGPHDIPPNEYLRSECVVFAQLLRVSVGG